MHLTGEELTHAQAHETMQNLILAYGCQQQTTKLEGYEYSWRESDYYNTIDRLEASFRSDFYISDIAGEDKAYIFPKDFCVALQKAMGEIQ